MKTRPNVRAFLTRNLVGGSVLRVSTEENAVAGAFEIARDGTLPTTPQEYWDAVTVGVGGWLWPMEFEPRLGGAAAFGTVTAWDPPRHLATRMEGPEGWFNQVEHLVTPLDAGGVRYRYVHSGVLTDDWDNQYDGASQHTDFYLHTLGEYLRHFSRRPVRYASLDAPAASTGADGFDVLKNALGLPTDAAEGDPLRLALPGAAPQDVTVDYIRPHFLGLRCADTMYRFFGRNAFGAPVGIALHLFAADADEAATEKVWQSFVDSAYS
jgi:hypothetical protein